MSEAVERIRREHAKELRLPSSYTVDIGILLARIDELEAERDEAGASLARIRKAFEDSSTDEENRLRTESAAGREVVLAVHAWGQVPSKDEPALMAARAVIWETMREYKKATDDE